MLPNGNVVTLKKFASMGSAVCFPIEAMVFFILCLLAGHITTNSRITKQSISELSSLITVFGDDLIIPVSWRYVCQNLLESIGLKVNHQKSFSDGHFRESCGTDAYNGHIVTPVYVRRLAPSSRRDTEEIVSFVATANNLYNKGYWQTAKFMREFLEDLIGPLPHVKDTSSLLGWRSFLGSYSVSRWNKALCRFEEKGFTLSTKKRSDPIEGPAQLFKYLLGRARSSKIGCHFLEHLKIDIGGSLATILSSSADLGKSVLRGSVYTKIRWTTSYYYDVVI